MHSAYKSSWIGVKQAELVNGKENNYTQSTNI